VWTFTNFAAAVSDAMWANCTYAIYAIYVLGSPYMINNMLQNRKREFKKRKDALSGKKAK